MDKIIVPDNGYESAVEYDYQAIGRGARDGTHQCPDTYPEDTFAAAGSMASVTSRPSTGTKPKVT
jgi:hypothetical protein